jgi:hypothetical protein
VIAHANGLDTVFVLRFLRREVASEQSDPTQWRVRISEVNTGREIYAEGLESACRLLRSILLGQDI